MIDPGKTNEVPIGHHARELVALDRKLAEIVYAILIRHESDLELHDRERLARFLEPLERAIAEPPPEDPEAELLR